MNNPSLESYYVFSVFKYYAFDHLPCDIFADVTVHRFLENKQCGIIQPHLMFLIYLLVINVLSVCRSLKKLKIESTMSIKYKFLIKKRENVGIKHCNNPNAFIEYSNTMDDVYKNIDDYNPNRKRKILIVFDDMIADIMTNKKFQSIIKELFIRCRKLNISLVFITQSYFSVPNDARLNSTHYLIMKINNRKELQNIAINHSADIDYKDFMKIYRECIKKLYSFLTIDTTLPASNSLRFRKNLFDSYKNDSK